MTPLLSPKKTIEGGLGGVLTACACSWLFFDRLVPLLVGALDGVEHRGQALRAVGQQRHAVALDHVRCGGRPRHRLVRTLEPPERPVKVERLWRDSTPPWWSTCTLLILTSSIL